VFIFTLYRFCVERYSFVGEAWEGRTFWERGEEEGISQPMEGDFPKLLKLKSEQKFLSNF
jgi:hypothetical protein